MVARFRPNLPCPIVVAYSNDASPTFSKGAMGRVAERLPPPPAGIAVNWGDGAHGGPEVDWLLRMWALAVELAAGSGAQAGEGGAADGRWAALDLWPLLPLADGRLMRVRHCGLLLPGEAVAGAGAHSLAEAEEPGQEAPTAQVIHATPAGMLICTCWATTALVTLAPTAVYTQAGSTAGAGAVIRTLGIPTRPALAWVNCSRQNYSETISMFLWVRPHR